MDFKVKELWSTEKYYRPSWLAEKRNFWNLDSLEWLKLKQYYFDLSDSLLIVSVLKLFLFFFVSLFFFLLLKKWRVHAPHLPVPAALNIIRVYIRYLVVNNTHWEKFRNSSIQEYAILAVSDFCLQNQLKLHNSTEFYLFYKECRCLNKVSHQNTQKMEDCLCSHQPILRQDVTWTRDHEKYYIKMTNNWKALTTTITATKM